MSVANWLREPLFRTIGGVFKRVLLILSLWISIAIVWVTVSTAYFISPLSIFDGVFNSGTDRISLAILTFALLTAIASEFSPKPILPAFRDVMTRFFTVYSAGLIQLTSSLILLLIITELSSKSGLSDLEGGVIIWMGISTAVLSVIYLIRLLPWIKAYRLRFQSWIKGKFIPPYNDSWHHSAPLVNNRAVEPRPYREIDPFDLDRRNLRKPIAFSVAFYLSSILLLFAIIGGLLWQYPQALTNGVGGEGLTTSQLTQIFTSPSAVVNIFTGVFETGRQGSPSASLLSGLSGLGWPGSFLSAVISYFGLSDASLLTIVLVFLLPVTLLFISLWNFCFVYEEAQYRLLRYYKGILDADSAVEDIIILGMFHILMVVHSFTLIGSFALYGIMKSLIVLVSMFALYGFLYTRRDAIEEYYNENEEAEMWVPLLVFILPLLVSASLNIF